MTSPVDSLSKGAQSSALRATSERAEQLRFTNQCHTARLAAAYFCAVAIAAFFTTGQMFASALLMGAAAAFVGLGELSRRQLTDPKGDRVAIVAALVGGSAVAWALPGQHLEFILLASSIIMIGGFSVYRSHEQWILFAGLCITITLSIAGTAFIYADQLPNDSEGLIPFFARAGAGFLLLSFIWMTVRHLETKDRLLEELASNALEARNAESRFLSNMSHEIRNPLNGILGLIDQASDETDLATIRDQLATAAAAGNHLKHIVDDILDLKKLEEGEFKLHPASLDLTELRRTNYEALAPLLKQKQISFVNETDDATLPLYIIGDRVRLFQVAQNLLSNAIKFTPLGGTISVKVGYDHERGELYYRISDSGIGMTPETLATLFERFKQADASTTKHFQGSGLGLAIVKQLLDLMGGSIDVESAPGRGTTVEVRAPLPVDHQREAAGDTAEPAVLQVADADQLTGIRILCVDDSEINLKVVVRPLTKAGAVVAQALSAKAALDQISREEFDIVLTDISMPEMDGEQLFRRIRDEGLTMPVIAITGNVLEEDVARYLDNGFAAALPKPLDPQQLKRSIVKALRLAAPTADAATA